MMIEKSIIEQFKKITENANNFLEVNLKTN